MFYVCKSFLHTSTSGAHVQDYDPQIDEEAVRRIAIEHMSSLVSIELPNPKSPKFVFEASIRPALEHNDVYKKVLRLDNKAIGFVAYSTEQCWCGSYGKVEYLAIDSAYHSKGYGSILLKHALDAFKNGNIDFAYLDITKDESMEFYRKHHFKVLKYVNAKYAGIGHMGLNLKPKQGNLAMQCLDVIRIRKRLFPMYGFGLFFVGLGCALIGKKEQKPQLNPVGEK